MSSQITIWRPANEQASYLRDTILFLHRLGEQFQIPLDINVEEGCSPGTALEVHLQRDFETTNDYTHRTWQVFRNENMEQIHLIQGSGQDEKVFLEALTLAKANGGVLHWVLAGETAFEGNNWTAMLLAAQANGVELTPVSAREAGRVLLKDPVQMPVLLAGVEAGEVLTGLIGDSLGVFGVFTEQRQESDHLKITVVTDGRKGYLIPIQLGEILVRQLGAAEAAKEVRKTGSRIMNWLVQPGAGADPTDLPLDERWGLLLTTALTDGEGFAPRRRRIDESFSTII